MPARSAILVSADGLLPTFVDTARAYRFGPPGHDLAVAMLVAKDGAAIAHATWLLDFAAPPPLPRALKPTSSLASASS